MFVCRVCKGPTKYLGRHWKGPKRTNDRAWKRIESGEWLWDRRLRRRKTGFRQFKMNDTVERVEYETYQNEWGGKSRRPIESTRRTVSNLNRIPYETDLGG